MLGICFWLPFGVCTYLALTPAPALDTGSAPVNHVLAFGYLTPALRLAHFDRSGWRPVILWMLAYGIGLELVQGALPWRDAEVRDIALDGAGILAGVVLHRAVRWFRGRAKRGHAGSSAPRTADDDPSPDFSPSHLSDAEMPASTALNAARVLDVPSSPARPDSRSPCRSRHLRALASRSGEKSGLVPGPDRKTIPPCSAS